MTYTKIAIECATNLNCDAALISKLESLPPFSPDHVAEKIVRDYGNHELCAAIVEHPDY